MKTNSHRKSNGYSRGGARRIIDADGHVRETDEQIMEYMSAGYRSRRNAMLYFPLVPPSSCAAPIMIFSTSNFSSGIAASAAWRCYLFRTSRRR